MANPNFLSLNLDNFVSTDGTDERTHTHRFLEPLYTISPSGNNRGVGGVQPDITFYYFGVARRRRENFTLYYSKDSSHHGFVRELSYGRISKVFENRDFQIWDYGAEKLDLVRHSYS